MPSTVAFTILLIPVHDDGEKMNILRAWHFKSCDNNFFMTIIHLPVFADEFYFVFARCATSHWSLLLPVALFACLSFSPCDNLDFPPSVNRFAINLKGFFASTRIDSMILHEKVRKKIVYDREHLDGKWCNCRKFLARLLKPSDAEKLWWIWCDNVRAILLT